MPHGFEMQERDDGGTERQGERQRTAVIYSCDNSRVSICSRRPSPHFAPASYMCARVFCFRRACSLLHLKNANFPHICFTYLSEKKNKFVLAVIHKKEVPLSKQEVCVCVYVCVWGVGGVILLQELSCHL